MVILSEKHPQGWNFKPYTEKLPFIHVEGQYNQLKLGPNHNGAIVWTLKAMNITIWTKLSQKHQKTSNIGTFVSEIVKFVGMLA